MDDTSILDAPWPPDLDPATVSFRTRTATILHRMGYVDDPSRLDTLTEGEVMSWWNAGPRTVADIRGTGNAAIRRHHERAVYLPELRSAMSALATEVWPQHIWPHDPRFAEYLPKSDATVHDIAISGSLEDQWVLWGNLEALRGAVDAQAALSLPEAVAQYVEAISGQHGKRLEVLLARTGLDGQDPITNREMARRLCVSDQRASQIVQRLWYHLDRCRPPEGVWMPQVAEAERSGRPNGFTEAGTAAARRLCSLA